MNIKKYSYRIYLKIQVDTKKIKLNEIFYSFNHESSVMDLERRLKGGLSTFCLWYQKSRKFQLIYLGILGILVRNVIL